MKFSKGARETIEVTNYNPGPGFYYNFNKEQQQELINQVLTDGQKTTWNKQDRFQYQEQQIKQEVEIPAVGAYNIAQPIGNTQSPNKNKKKLRTSTVDNKLLKVNAIPSIPSGGQIPGYQEIGDGLLILIKEPQKNLQQINTPIQYDVKYTQTKKKIPGFVIKEKNHQSILKEIENHQELDKLKQQQNKEFLELNPLTETGNTFIQDSKKNDLKNIAEIKKKLIKSSTTRHIDQQNWLTREDYNLELMHLREKMRGQFSKETPAPGYYFKPDKASTLSLQNKPIELQCFDSSAPKFEIKKIPEEPGVGEYDLQHIDQIKSLPFNREERGELFRVRLDQQFPSAGAYDTVKPFTQTTKHQQSQNFPTPFNSGSTRFKSQTNFKLQKSEGPSPGQYQIKSFTDKFKKKRRQQSQQQQQFISMQKQIQQQEQIQKQQQSQSIKLELAHDNMYEDDIYSEGSTQVSQKGSQDLQQFNQKLSQKYSSSFNSKVKRFQNEYRSMTGEQVGPGHYTLSKKIQIDSHNKNPKGNMGQSFKKTDIGVKPTACPKKVGPQTYDPNINAVKFKKTYSIQI